MVLNFGEILRWWEGSWKVGNSRRYILSPPVVGSFSLTAASQKSGETDCQLLILRPNTVVEHKKTKVNRQVARSTCCMMALASCQTVNSNLYSDTYYFYEVKIQHAGDFALQNLRRCFFHGFEGVTYLKKILLSDF